jgi:hypothetical protein
LEFGPINWKAFAIIVGLLAAAYVVCLIPPSVSEATEEAIAKNRSGEKEPTTQMQPTAQSYRSLEPEKVAYDKLPRVPISSSDTDDDLLSMRSAYASYLKEFPTSPLIVEVGMLRKEVESQIERRLKIREAKQRFYAIPQNDIREINAYPQKHIGLIFRTDGTIKMTGIGPAWEHYHYISSAVGEGILVSVEYDLARELAKLLQGKPHGIHGEFAVQVGRDARTSSIKYFLKEAWGTP